MERLILTDAQWVRMAQHRPGKSIDQGQSGRDNQLFVEAALSIARTGSPWRDLPATFGRWTTMFKRFRDWGKADDVQRLFRACSDKPDMDFGMLDGTIVKLHRHGQGA